MDFTRIKQLVVPEGVVKKIEIGGQSIWQSEPEEMNGPFTAAQSAAIRAGDFTDVPVGYAWIFSNVPYTYVSESNATVSDTYSGTMRVADCDYYLGTGDVECTTHHVVVVPDASMYSAKMNKKSTTSGGYIGSNMYTTHLRRARAIFEACFGASHILVSRDLLSYDMTPSTSSYPAEKLKWANVLVELMNEYMVWGTSNHASSTASSSLFRKQFSLFKNEPTQILLNSRYWLRTIARSPNYNDFICVTAEGTCSASASASNSYGVRPYALIY